jgi:tetratricopeptide (TPR) repeat protein
VRMLGMVCAGLLAVAGVACADVKGSFDTFLNDGIKKIGERKFGEAHALFKQAKAATKATAELDQVAIWTSRALATEGKIEESRAALRVALKNPSGTLAAEMGRSWLKYQPIEPKEAIKFLLDVVKSYGAKDPEPWLVLGKAYVVDQQYVSAIQIYNLLLKNVKKDEVRAFTGLADAYILAAKYQEAHDAMDRAARVHPEHPDVLFYTGRVKERDARVKNRSSIAAHYYQAASNAAKRDARYAAAAMFAFLNAGETTSAISLYNAQKNYTPGDSYVLWFEGLNEELGWKIPEAIALYERAIAANPENVYAHYVLARVLLGIGNKSLRLSGVEPPENFRVAPFRNTARGAQEVATIKFLDPSFPHLEALNQVYNKIMERQIEEESMSSEEKKAVQQLLNYSVKMNRYR